MSEWTQTELNQWVHQIRAEPQIDDLGRLIPFIKEKIGSKSTVGLSQMVKLWRWANCGARSQAHLTWGYILAVSVTDCVTLSQSLAVPGPRVSYLYNTNGMDSDL